MTEKTYRVHFNTGASATVTVTVPEQEDEEFTREAAIDAAYNEVPTLCAHCSGLGQGFGMDLGDWEMDTDEYAITEVEQ